MVDAEPSFRVSVKGRQLIASGGKDSYRVVTKSIV
jgi:hypothetical protein